MFTRSASLSFVLIVLVLLGSAHPGLAEFDVTIHVKDLHITGDTDPAFNDPDPYIIIVLQKPEPGHGVVGLGVSPTIGGQAVCTHPHVCRTFIAPHFNPITIKWQVMDDDLVFDDVMTTGSAGLVPGGGPVTVGSVGPDADIELEVTQAPSACGANWDTVSRDLPDSSEPNTSVLVTLNLHIDETASPELVTLYEQIPAGFMFEDANPAPASVTSVTVDEDFDLTVVTWEFPSPPVGDTLITYNVITPSSAGQLGGLFASQIDVDGTVYYVLLGENDIAIGPTGACCISDGTCLDSLPQTACELLEGVFGGGGSECLGDANGNGIDDACEELEPIPTVSEWGLIVMLLLALTAGTIIFGRRRRPAVA